MAPRGLGWRAGAERRPVTGREITTPPWREYETTVREAPVGPDSGPRQRPRQRTGGVAGAVGSLTCPPSTGSAVRPSSPC